MVVLTATKGFCVDTAIRFIKVDIISELKVPNVITPNGDGNNDLFFLDALNMGQITMTVFDRWGIKMFEHTDTGKMSWDGKNTSGNIVTDGTYFYIIKASGLDDKGYDLKGTITVFK
jgi:gliding motility-associated-like protein